METQSKKSWPRRHPILTGLGIFSILLLILSSGGDSKPSSTGSTSSPEVAVEAIKVTPNALRKAYKANEVSADNQYKDKLVEMIGTVDSIGKDVLDEAYVTFDNGEQYSIDKVQCMFKEDQQGSLATLKKGQEIKVQGKVSGVSIGNVIVRNCKVL